MTVSELIEHLQKFPQGLPVAYRLHSEACLLEVDYIHLDTRCAPRPDGWVHDFRSDKPSVQYLMFPGN